MTLKLKKAGSFWGVVPYYNEKGNLVFKFNQPAPIQKASNSYGYTLNGARITIDPGHGLGDPGAIGIGLNGIYEREINQAIADKVKAILEDLGASVHMNTSKTEKLLIVDRLNQAKAFESHLFVSIHNNSASASARGTEAYYFNPFSQRFAKALINRWPTIFQRLTAERSSGIMELPVNMIFRQLLLNMALSQMRLNITA